MTSLLSFLFFLNVLEGPGWTTAGENGFCQVYDIQSVSDGLLIAPQYFDSRVGYRGESEYHLSTNTAGYAGLADSLNDALNQCKQVQFYLVDNEAGYPDIEDVTVVDKTRFFNAATNHSLDHVPGTVLSYKDPAEETGLEWDYPAYPELLQMDGYILAAYESSNNYDGDEKVFAVARSEDGGVSWKVINHFPNPSKGCLLFSKGSDVYAMYRKPPNLVVRKSTDGGFTWTQPKSELSGLFSDDYYVVGSTDYIVHDQRIYIPIMDYFSGDKEYSYRSDGTYSPVNYSWIGMCVMSASLDDDFLDVDSWTFSNPVEIDDYRSFHPRYDTSRVRIPPGSTNEDGTAFVNFGTIAGWLEPTIVYDEAAQKITMLARVEENPVRVQTSSDGDVTHWVGGIAGKLVYDDATAELAFEKFIELPGASKRFVVVYDESTEKYYTMSNWWPDRWKATKTNSDGLLMVESNTRNIQVLAESSNLDDWTIKTVLLYTPEYTNRAFQYVDFEINGDDLIALSRTAFWDGEKEADSQHDANMITFHRFEDFRALDVDNSLLGNADNQLVREYNLAEDVIFYDDFDHYTNATLLTSLPGWSAHTGAPKIQNGILKYGNSKSEYDFTESYALDDSTVADHNVDELWIRIRGWFPGDSDEATFRLGVGNSAVTNVDEFGRYGSVHIRADSDLTNLVELRAISQNQSGESTAPPNDVFADIYCKLSNNASGNLSVQVWYDPADPQNPGTAASSSVQEYNEEYGGRVINRIEINAWGGTSGYEHEVKELAVGMSLDAILP